MGAVVDIPRPDPPIDVVIEMLEDGPPGNVTVCVHETERCVTLAFSPLNDEVVGWCVEPELVERNGLIKAVLGALVHEHGYRLVRHPPGVLILLPPAAGGA